MGIIRLYVSWKNTGNAIIPVLNISAGVYNGKALSKTYSYKNVKPGQSDSITFEFTDVPGGYWYNIWVEASDETGKTLARVSRRQFLPAYRTKHATIKILGYGRGYVRVSILNDGNVDGYFWVGCSICSYDETQCYDVPPFQIYLKRGESIERVITFDDSAAKAKVTKTPRKIVVAVWEGYDPVRNIMIYPQYSRAETYYYA
jgi:hypothetical protein